VEDLYAASEYILDSSDFTGVKFHATAKCRDQESR